MKNYKIILVVLLIACSFLSISQQAIAETSFRYETESWHLYRLGVFAGASKDRFNPDLGVTLDRQIGVTLLLNFFGLTPEIDKLSKNEIDQILSKYTDQGSILSWARKYMAYAIKTGVVMGTSTTTVGPNKPLDGLAFATMILRQLGFPVIDREEYKKSIHTLCNKAGLGQSDINYFNKEQLIKDDAVGMIYAALFAESSNGKTLINNLINSGIVSMETAVALNLVQYNDPGAIEHGGGYTPPARPAGYQQAYFQIYDALASATDSIWLIKNEYTDTFEEITDMVNVCVRENPSIMYFSGISYRTDGLLSFKYSKDSETIKRHKSELEKKVEAVLKEIIKPGMTPYQKEIAIHDYLINNCEYDYEGFESNKIKDESFTAYGALCLGIAVCEGYAEAADIMLNRSGVESRIISGKSRGYGHAWNLVKIEGEYYHLDITWDDTAQLSSDGKQRYYYFNLSDEDIKKDHEWVKADYPACTARKYHYYFYNDLVVKNQDEFISRVLEEVKMGNKDFSFKIIDANGFDIKAAADIIVKELFLGCRFSYNSDHQVAIITII